ELRGVLKKHLAAWRASEHPLVQTIHIESDPRAITWRPSSDIVFTGSASGLVRRYDKETSEPVGTPWKHTAPVRTIVFTHDGKHLVVAGGTTGMTAAQLTVFIRDSTTGDQIGEGMPHPQPVRHAVFGKDRKELFTACQDGLVRRWSAAD